LVELAGVVMMMISLQALSVFVTFFGDWPSLSSSGFCCIGRRRRRRRLSSSASSKQNKVHLSAKGLDCVWVGVSVCWRLSPPSSSLNLRR
jgi:hypothetical protein